MPGITHLIEVFEPIASSARCGAVLDRFLDAPGCDLLVVADHGRPIGVIGRGAVRPSEADRPVYDVMARPLTVEADIDLDQACALLLGHTEPTAGLVVIEAGRYRGVVSMRSMLRARRDESAEQLNSERLLDLISHEIRSPMNGVVAVAELLQRQPLSSDSQAFVRTILESSQATLRAINDAVELSRAEFGEMTLDAAPVLLREYIDGVQFSWHGRVAREGFTLLVSYDGEPDLNATIDGGRVRQVFDKLIEAAVTVGRGGTVEASLQAVRSLDGLRLIGRVRDSSGGLSASHLLEAFAPGGRRRGVANLGLGPSLCQRIIARMGGSIRADSNVGAGVTVTFEFNAAETVAAADKGVSELNGMRNTAHVLVVDDNATNRMVAEALCEMFDCTSECAEDGVEAVEAARSGRFDLILMDIRMPRMDGVEATRAIRALPGAAGMVPIIALTANADPEDAKTYVDCGMHSVVEKPIKPERLLQAITAALPAASGRAAAAA
ncbi:MAG: response regulator [Caulobacteraceae bacterium]|nr:response regulator [Caulobacteraceae bacterium]